MIYERILSVEDWNEIARNFVRAREGNFVKVGVYAAEMTRRSTLYMSKVVGRGHGHQN